MLGVQEGGTVNIQAYLNKKCLLFQRMFNRTRKGTVKTVMCRCRASDVWFDDECRAARKKCRWLERRCNRSPVYKKQWLSEFRRYRQLTRRKRAEFWRTSIDEYKSSPQHLWHSIDKLMGREKQAASPDITASDFQKYFVDKIAAVRASTDGASDPTFRLSPEVTELNTLRSVDLDEVTLLISSLPNKQCRSDPLPTWLLKECTAELAPFICRLFNVSLRSDCVPQLFKSAYITPLLKKVGLDNTDTKVTDPSPICR